MTHYDDNDRKDMPQPAADPETGSSGSAENRRGGLKREADDTSGEADDT